MKRAQFLFEQIISFENLRLAWLKARKGKTSKRAVINFAKNVQGNLEDIRKRMIAEVPVLLPYHQFKVFDPKERTISVVPFADRVLHHAIINVLEPIFEKQFIYHTYACRKNKGTHKAALYAAKKAKTCSCYVKLDVRKFFDSVDHTVLKCQLARIIKDKKTLTLLFAVIDSYRTEGVQKRVSKVVSQEALQDAPFYAKTERHEPNPRGLPIGNLTSQFFANLYLSSLDHFIIERLKPAGFVRYMDDMIVFANDMDLLKELYRDIAAYCYKELHLLLKEPVFKRTKNGMCFLGWNIFPHFVKVSAKVQKRMNRKLADVLRTETLGFFTDAVSDTALQRIKTVYRARALVYGFCA